MTRMQVVTWRTVAKEMHGQREKLPSPINRWGRRFKLHLWFPN